MNLEHMLVGTAVDFVTRHVTRRDSVSPFFRTALAHVLADRFQTTPDLIIRRGTARKRLCYNNVAEVDT